MLNKKSQVEDWLQLLLIIAVVVIAILVLSIKSLDKGRESEERISSQIIIKDSGQLLLNYLRSPLNSDDSNIADKLNEYFLTEDENILTQITTETDNFFTNSNLETDFSSWSLEIKHPDKNILIIESGRSRTERILRKQLSRIIIPTSSNNKFIEIKLFIVTTRFVSK